MKNILFGFLLVFFFISSATVIAENDGAKSPETPASTLSMSGKVLDATSGEALAGALVEVEGSNIRVFTDLDGQFTITNMQSGTYALKVKYISYEDKKVEAVKVDTKNNTLNISLQSK